VKRARILLWDGGTQVILGVPVTNLYFDAKAQLSTWNPIIKLTRYNEVTYVDKGSSTRLHGLVILQHQFLCRPAITTIDASSLEQSKFKEGSASIESIPAEPRNSDVLAREVLSATSAFHHATIAHNNNESLRTLPEVQFCKSGDDSLCSRCGVEFKICVAEQHFEEMKTPEFLNAVSEHCHFVDREVKDMTNSLKRNLLHWWFATNVYFVKGAANRKQLLNCLECAIRMACPNPKEKPCGLFQPKLKP
jgi:hypothetical protein